LDSGWQRWVPLSGILFVVLFVIGFLLGTGPDDSDDAKLLAWYADSGHQTAAVIGAYAFALAGVSMLFFINRIRAVVAAAEPGNAILAPFIASAGTIFVAGLMVAAATFAAIPAEAKLGSGHLATNADLLRFFPSIGFGALLVLGMFPLIAAMLVTAYASMKLGIFPSWFNWLTIVCAIVLIFAVEFVPLIGLAVWLIAGTVVLMGKQPAAAAIRGPVTA
jgi:hypothetical protein